MTNPDRPAVELHRVSKWYGEVVAVADLSFAVHGGVVGLLGPNGAGKTTTLKLLTGLARPSLGEIRVFGRPLRRNPSLYRSIGVVLDGERLYPRMTARTYVRLHAELHGIRRPESATEQALGDVDLHAIADRRLRGLSKGQRQRVKVAAALINRPLLLVLDEPMAGLDPVQRAGLVELIRRLAADGVTVIVSSHILAEVEQLASEIAVLVNGRLAASGDPRGIRRLLAEQRPLTVRIRADGARELAAGLVALPSTVSVLLYDDVVEASTRSAEALALELPRLARELDIGLREVCHSDDSLEHVFEYLVER